MELAIEKVKGTLCNYSEGKKIYHNLKWKIDKNEKDITIIFPEKVETVALNFVNGLLEEMLLDKKNIKVIANGDSKNSIESACNLIINSYKSEGVA